MYIRLMHVYALFKDYACLKYTGIDNLSHSYTAHFSYIYLSIFIRAHNLNTKYFVKKSKEIKILNDKQLSISKSLCLNFF